MKNKLLLILSLLCSSLATHADVVLPPKDYYSVYNRLTFFFQSFSAIKWMEVPYLITFFISLTIITTIITIKIITWINKKKIIKLYFFYILLLISLIFPLIFGIKFRNCFYLLGFMEYSFLHPETAVLVEIDWKRKEELARIAREPQMPSPPDFKYNFKQTFHKSSISKLFIIHNILFIWHIFNNIIIFLLLFAIIAIAIITLVKKRKLPILKQSCPSIRYGIAVILKLMIIILLHSLSLFIILFSFDKYITCKSFNTQIEYNGKEYTVEDFQKEFDIKKILEDYQKEIERYKIDYEYYEKKTEERRILLERIKKDPHYREVYRNR